MALFLRQQGYRAWALKGGYQAWRRAGYPVEPKEMETTRTVEGACPECGQPVDAHV